MKRAAFSIMGTSAAFLAIHFYHEGKIIETIVMGICFIFYNLMAFAFIKNDLE